MFLEHDNWANGFHYFLQFVVCQNKVHCQIQELKCPEEGGSATASMCDYSVCPHCCHNVMSMVDDFALRVDELKVTVAALQRLNRSSREYSGIISGMQAAARKLERDVVVSLDASCDVFDLLDRLRDGENDFGVLFDLAAALNKKIRAHSPSKSGDSPSKSKGPPSIVKMLNICFDVYNEGCYGISDLSSEFVGERRKMIPIALVCSHGFDVFIRQMSFTVNSMDLVENRYFDQLRSSLHSEGMVVDVPQFIRSDVWADFISLLKQSHVYHQISKDVDYTLLCEKTPVESLGCFTDLYTELSTATDFDTIRLNENLDMAQDSVRGHVASITSYRAKLLRHSLQDLPIVLSCLYEFVLLENGTFSARFIDELASRAVACYADRTGDKLWEPISIDVFVAPGCAAAAFENALKDHGSLSGYLNQAAKDNLDIVIDTANANDERINVRNCQCFSSLISLMPTRIPRAIELVMLPEHVITQYKSLQKFIMRIHFTKWCLNDIYKRTRGRTLELESINVSDSRRVHAFISHASAFINALLHYVLLDVVQAEWAAMVADIGVIRDNKIDFAVRPESDIFHSCQNAQNKFFQNVNQRLLFGSQYQAMQSVLTSILDQCVQYARALQKAWPYGSMTNIHKIATRFERRVSYVCQVLTNLRQMDHGFYSSAAGGLLGRIDPSAYYVRRDSSNLALSQSWLSQSELDQNDGFY